MTTDLSYSIKQAPLAGVEIDWYFVEMVDHTYEYMLHLRGVAAATKTQVVQVLRFCALKGWSPVTERVPSSTKRLELKVKSPQGTEQTSHLLTATQVTDYIFHRAVENGDENCKALSRALMAESLETRFDQLFNKPLKTAEQKDTELVARLTKDAAEQTIKNLGQRLHAAGGSASHKREFLNLLLEGHTAKELVEKELKDAEGHVLMGKGSGKKRSYTKLNLCDPTHAEHLRELYQKIAHEMCFVPVGVDYKAEWLTIASKELKRSKLPQAVKTEMLTRVVSYTAQ